MLLADFGQHLWHTSDLAAWIAALRVHAGIQQASIERRETLLAVGCFDRRLNMLAEAVDPLLGDDRALAGIDPEERERFRSLGPRLKTHCDELASLGLPDTLVHGDLHPGNIAMRDGQPVFFDWTDGCLAHPFIDLLPFVEAVEGLADEPDAWSRLRDGYLAEWTAFGSMEFLNQAFALAEPLGALHQSISYRHLVANTEGPSQRTMLHGVSYWVRHVLKAMADVDAQPTP
jgi:Ser/Thr protein kinase RdoA (MazF antagonist)